jgi:hypothetical protein
MSLPGAEPIIRVNTRMDVDCPALSTVARPFKSSTHPRFLALLLALGAIGGCSRGAVQWHKDAEQCE